MRLQQMDQLKPAELFELLFSHDLIPKGVPETMLLNSVRFMSENSAFCLVVDGEGDEALVLASAITMPIDDHSLMFTWIPEVKRLHTRKTDLIDLAVELRALWFQNGVKRVEARSTTKRTQTIRTLKNIGFKQETLDSGLRSGVDYGKGPEGVVILGMLESDPLRHMTDALGHKSEEAPIMQEEVAHG